MSQYSSRRASHHTFGICGDPIPYFNAPLISTLQINNRTRRISTLHSIIFQHRRRPRNRRIDSSISSSWSISSSRKTLDFPSKADLWRLVVNLIIIRRRLWGRSVLEFHGLHDNIFTFRCNFINSRFSDLELIVNLRYWTEHFINFRQQISIYSHNNPFFS